MDAEIVPGRDDHSRNRGKYGWTCSGTWNQPRQGTMRKDNLVIDTGGGVIERRKMPAPFVKTGGFSGSLPLLT
ncbi:MAG: hypothetical protein R2861_04345 [Desulfobacterales bacterium]